MIKEIHIAETIDQLETDGPLEQVQTDFHLDVRLQIWEDTRLILDSTRRIIVDLIEDDLIK